MDTSPYAKFLSEELLDDVLLHFGYKDILDNEPETLEFGAFHPLINRVPIAPEFHLTPVPDGTTTWDFKKEVLFEAVRELRRTLERVHITDIVPRDVVLHNGHWSTVCGSNIHEDSFMGRTLFGDNYRSGTRPVIRRKGLKK